jgi:hypothetical protein
MFKSIENNFLIKKEMKNTLKMISSKAKVAEDIIKHGEK